MIISLPEDVNCIIEELEKRGHEAYAVGGCVRDVYMGRTPHDWDITTSAEPDEIKEIFRKTIDTGLKHGTVTVRMHGESYEVTTYRIDGEYEDGRHPKEVKFTKSLEEDLKRRDFTVNAMAYNCTKGLVDLFDGKEDLEKKVIRCVGDPKERFTEDALRMMRAIRFSAQLGFSIEEETYDAIRKLSPTLDRISAERIREEMMKLLTSDEPEKFRLFYDTGLTKVFMPEFDVCMQTPQNTKHHDKNVGEHTLFVLGGVKNTPVLRLAALFHDIGKPGKRTTDEAGNDHFYKHPLLSEDLTKDIMNRLKFDNDTKYMVCKLVLYHDERPALNEKSVRRSMAKLGADCFPDMYYLKEADIKGQSAYKREEKLKNLETYRRLCEEVFEKQQALSVKDLKITGKDLLEIGIPQGKELGATLKRLLDAVIEDPEKNERETLLGMARQKV